LKECEKFILAFAIGKEEREVYGEVTGADKDFFGDFFSEIFSADCIWGQILE